MKSNNFDFSKVKVENDIPIPVERQLTKELKRRLENLKIGESIVIPKKFKKTVHTVRTMLALKDIRFVIRSISENSIRIWRLK